MRAAASVLVLAAVLALAGCSSAPVAAPTPAPQAVVTTAPTAAPTAEAAAQPVTVDTIYLSVLRKKGIGTSDDEREIRRAHAVCELFEGGSTYREVLDALTANGFTISDAGFFTGLAVSAYCSDQSSKLHA